MTVERIVEGALKSARIVAVSCGLNADWSISAWYLGGGSGCNKGGGGYYLLDEEDGTMSLVRRWSVDLEADAEEYKAHGGDGYNDLVEEIAVRPASPRGVLALLDEYRRSAQGGA